MSTYSTSHPDEKTVIVKLHQALDVHHVDEFQAEMQQMIQNEPNRIVLDCAEVDFVSSLGLAVLIRMQTRLRKKGGDLKLAAVQKPVRELLHFTRLDKVFDILPTAEEAHASFE